MAEKIEREFHELYKGEVIIEYLPKSHRYNLIKDGEELPKKKSLTGPSTISNRLDKSRQLIPWATRMYTEKVKEMMRDGVNFTVADVESMLKMGEVAHTEKSDRGKIIGTYVHTFCEEYAVDTNEKKARERMIKKEGEPIESYTGAIDIAIKGFVKMFTEEKVEILETESLIYSRKEGFTGRYDAILLYKEERYLADYKTSSGIFSSHYYQTSAYLKAKEEETGEKFAGALIVAIAKEDKEDKNGNIIKKAGEVTFEFRSRGDLVKDYVAFKGLRDVDNREKELQKEWREKMKTSK